MKPFRDWGETVGRVWAAIGAAYSDHSDPVTYTFETWVNGSLVDYNFDSLVLRMKN